MSVFYNYLAINHLKTYFWRLDYIKFIHIIQNCYDRNTLRINAFKFKKQISIVIDSYQPRKMCDKCRNVTSGDAPNGGLQGQEGQIRNDRWKY